MRALNNNNKARMVGIRRDTHVEVGFHKAIVNV